MALSSNWFAGVGSPSYTEIRCDFDESGASQTNDSDTGSGGVSWTYTRYGPCGWLIYLPNKRGGPDDLNRKDPEYGYIYCTNDDDSDAEIGIHYVDHPLEESQAYSRATGNNLYRPFAKGSNAYIELFSVSSADDYTTHIFQPYAWYGRVGQVIAAMLLANGLSSGYFNIDAFSDADDGQAAMGSTDSDEPFVFYRREVGQRLGEAVKKLAQHSWDIVCIGMDSKVGMYRRVGTHADFTITTLDQDDGVISSQWRYAHERLVNHAWLCEGMYYDCTTADFDDELGVPPVQAWGTIALDTTPVAFPTDIYDSNTLPFEEFSDSTSITKYGERFPGARQTEVKQGNEIRVFRYYHLPYLCNMESGTDDMDAKGVLLARLASVEADLRREVTVVQDGMGFDYDVGWKVASVAVTEDGATITDTRCIKKKINFRDMTVTSVLLEETT